MKLNYILDFFIINWLLYLNLIFNIFIEYNNSLITEQLNNKDIYYKKIFDSYLFNFIYILMPFYNIGIKIAQNEVSKKINFTNMIKLNFLLSLFISFIAFYFQKFYFINMNIKNEKFSMYLIAVVIISNSFFNSLNGYLIGSNNNKKLIKFNLIYMILVLITNKIIVVYKLNNYKIIYTKNIPIIISCFYLLYINRYLILLSYLFSNQLKLINYGIELIIRNIFTLFNVNLDNYSSFKMSKIEIKTFEIMRSNLNNFIIIYTPLSTIIQKKTYSKNFINNISKIYITIAFIIVNIINNYYWNMNFIIVNCFNFLYFFNFTNEAKNISYNNIRKSISVLILLIFFKLTMINILNISTAASYYQYIIFVLLTKIILNFILQ